MSISAMKQKLIKAIKNEEGFSFVEVIIVIAMILILTAILVPSYLGFIETAREANVKISAQNMYTAVQTTRLAVEDLSTSEELYTELKELVPSLVGVGAYKASDEDQSQDPDNTYLYIANFTAEGYDPGKLADINENACAISNITIEDLGFTFTYFQCLGNKVYCVEFVNGENTSVNSFTYVSPTNDSNDNSGSLFG